MRKLKKVRQKEIQKLKNKNHFHRQKKNQSEFKRFGYLSKIKKKYKKFKKYQKKQNTVEQNTVEKLNCASKC